MRDRRKPGWLTNNASDASSDASDSFDDDDDGFALDDDLSITGLAPTGATPWSLWLARVAPRLRGVWRLSGALALALLAATVVIALAPHLPRPASPRVQVPYTAMAMPSDLVHCLNGAAWSPDGREVAAVQSPSCSDPYLGPPPMTADLILFDAATGKQVATYALDDAVNTTLKEAGLTSSGDVAYTLSYYAADWSPNARFIAVRFMVFSHQINIEGVAVVTLSGAERNHIRIALGAPNTSLVSPDNGFALVPVTRWDLTRGDQATIYLAPALAYRWLPSDVLVADAPLPSNASAPAPAEPTTTATAAPLDGATGGQTFSMWSDGEILPVTAVACGANGATAQTLRQPYALLWLTATAWSPDGRYLLESDVQARLPTIAVRPLASTSDVSPCDSGPAPNQLPNAPLHDKALGAALRLLDPQGDNQLSLAWSRDGRRLAVSSADLTSQATRTVVYDSASGATLATFTGDEFAETSGGVYSTQNPIWSPDGGRLLMTINGPVAKLVILGPQALGA